jgi:putative ABC transport system substrate-binding protein
MRRRQFIAMAGSMAAWPLMAYAQSSTRPRRLGILLWSKQDLILISPMLKGLEALGYVEGRNVVVSYVDVEGEHDRLAGAAAELVSLKPDVIFSFGGEQAPFVKNATATIPIVVVVSNDPVQSGLVSSLGRPGGNITGVTYVHDMLAGKSVELLKDTAPSVARVAILWNPNHVDPEFRETQRASRALGVQLQSLEIREPGDIEGAFLSAEREKAEALIVLGSRLMFSNRHRIVAFAERHRLMMVGVPSWLMEVGALLTYGPNTPELFRSAAGYVDKILKRARPALYGNPGVFLPDHYGVVNPPPPTAPAPAVQR